jgi:hypothetical protein
VPPVPRTVTPSLTPAAVTPRSLEEDDCIKVNIKFKLLIGKNQSTSPPISISSSSSSTSAGFYSSAFLLSPAAACWAPPEAAAPPKLIDPTFPNPAAIT